MSQLYRILNDMAEELAGDSINLTSLEIWAFEAIEAAPSEPSRAKGLLLEFAAAAGRGDLDEAGFLLSQVNRMSRATNHEDGP